MASNKQRIDDLDKKVYELEKGVADLRIRVESLEPASEVENFKGVEDAPAAVPEEAPAESQEGI